MKKLTDLEMVQMKGSILDSSIQLKKLENNYMKIAYATPILSCFVSFFISLMFALRSTELSNKILLIITAVVWIISLLRILDIKKQIKNNQKEIVLLENKIKDLEKFYNLKYISLSIIKK